ncbi:MAG: hypothetical protein WD801_03730 [Gemmatimonadaceae bacterium]
MLLLLLSLSAGPIAPVAPVAPHFLPQQRPETVTVVRDSTPADSTPRTGPRRRAVTPELAASAFASGATRDLYLRARRTRIAHDSSLMSYDAKVRQRLSVSGSIGRLGPQRLLYRRESAARVLWQRDVGARIEMTGGRVAIPLIGSPEEERKSIEESLTFTEMSPIPYFPGSETLWIGGSARAAVDERNVIHPLADGAEAYYTFRSGDSVSFRLPDGRVLLLREMAVRPRAPSPNVVVGSLWFDIASGQLVRAAYRLAAPAVAQIGVSSEDSNSVGPRIAMFMLGAVFSGSQFQLSSIVVEYGLHEGRFWLPRTQTMEGLAEAAFARVPIRFDNAFEYASVNGALELAAIHVDTTVRYNPTRPPPPPGLDTAAARQWRDSVGIAYTGATKARSDSVKQGLRVGSMAQCDSADTRVVTQYRYRTRLPVEVRVPCDLDVLINSADLPESIYDSGEEIFGDAERDQLLADALSMAAQAPFAFGMLPRAQIVYGLPMTRYNRVEGFSTGLTVEQRLGAGLSAAVTGRLGTADRVGNWAVSLARTNMSRTVSVTGYRRLVSANDWGSPLSFGSSVSAFLFGRDEGFYYRASGAELLWNTERGARLEWRAFHEKQMPAEPRTTFSVGGSFIPNILAPRLTSSGVSVRHLGTFGLDPRGFRAVSDLRLEGASGDSTYGRGALDVTVSRGYGRAAAALTLAGGSSAGGVPLHRRWFLGGTQTVRGQSADTAQSGNAFWLTRLELARSQVGYRTAIFGDIGWVGNRTALAEVGRPMSGVGVGFSAFDGLIRLDVARGIYPRRQTRFDLYLGARF